MRCWYQKYMRLEKYLSKSEHLPLWQNLCYTCKKYKNTSVYPSKNITKILLYYTLRTKYLVSKIIVMDKDINNIFLKVKYSYTDLFILHFYFLIIINNWWVVSKKNAKQNKQNKWVWNDCTIKNNQVAINGIPENYKHHLKFRFLFSPFYISLWEIFSSEKLFISNNYQSPFCN